MNVRREGMVSRLLAVETSSEACSVALALGGAVAERHVHAPLRHAELLLPSVQALLDEADAALGMLDAIVFGRGPGSFTSLRIGIGAVQGLAWGAGLPVVPISSLAAVAQQAVDRGADQVVVAMDARMGEVFSASFRAGPGGPEVLGDERVGPPGGVAVARPERTVGCGNGFQRYPELQRLGRSLEAVEADLSPRAAALIPLARAWLKSGQPLSAERAQPIYVRDHVANTP